MLKSVMFWNEPNNKSHWDPDLDPDWSIFGAMVKEAGRMVHEVNPAITRVLGGMSPIDAGFIKRLEDFGVLEQMDAVAVHGFPLDWNHWPLNAWPERLAEIQACTALPVWVTEVGISTFGADEVQDFGLKRTHELIAGKAPKIFWYSLYDLPKHWIATTRHREAEGSSYYRHYYLGLLDEFGKPKQAYETFKQCTPDFGICQWFHYHDHRLDEAVERLHDLGVKYIRTGLSWADSFRENADEWFDRQMEALKDFDVTATFCFTPEHRGLAPHHTSPPLEISEYAEFCARMVQRYAPAKPATPASQFIDIPNTGDAIGARYIAETPTSAPAATLVV